MYFRLSLDEPCVFIDFAILETGCLMEDEDEDVKMMQMLEPRCKA